MPKATEAMVFTDSYKQMECLGGMNFQSFLNNWSLCLPVQRRVTQLVYTNKIGDCLFVYLSICSAIGGQTARTKRLKFGG